jgi:hypothetical protein
MEKKDTLWAKASNVSPNRGDGLKNRPIKKDRFNIHNWAQLWSSADGIHSINAIIH